MAAATKNQGKTSFVKDYLSDYPQANSKAVNDAWAAAGMKGTISHTVVSEARKQLGLLGNGRGKTTPAARATAAPQSTNLATTTPGKTLFTKEFLNDHPEGNFKAVNEAWAAAGMKGTISKTVVDKMRALLGLSGNLHAKPQSITATKERGRPPKAAAATVNEKRSSARTTNHDRASALLHVEAEIDRLIFTLMGIGNLAEIETLLREARRRLYGALFS